jgi:hypothetical protein
VPEEAKMFGPRDHDECRECGATLIATPVCPGCHPEEASPPAPEPEEDYDAAWESERFLRYAEGWG